MMRYLDGKSEREVRQAIVAALATLQARGSLIEYSQLVYQTAIALGLPNPVDVGKAWADYQVGTERVQTSGAVSELPDNRKLLGCFWSLVGEGVIAPRFKLYPIDGHPLPIASVFLTARGERLVKDGDDHPLHPGFISRFRSRSSVMSNEVVARMEDAVSCLERSLLRPATIMIGLASEETLQVVRAALLSLSLLKKTLGPRANAKDLLDDIQKAIPNWPGGSDEQHRLRKAVAAAESIRTDRNLASHPGAVLSDQAAVEELLVLAGRQIPVFWDIVVQHAVTINGFAP